MNGNYTTNDNFNIHAPQKGARISCSRSTGLPQFKMFCLHCLSADYRGSICMLFFQYFNVYPSDLWHDTKRLLLELLHLVYYAGIKILDYFLFESNVEQNIPQ